MRPGELDLRAKLHFARQAVLAQLTGAPSLIRAHLTDGPRTPALLTDREPPDTPLTRDVLELAHASYAEPLLGHCLRTWVWGDLLGSLDGITPDAEGQAVRRKFRRAGNYTVTVKISDYYGLKEPVMLTVAVKVNP